MLYRVSILDKFEWQEPILDKDLISPPGSLLKGDRYLIYGVGIGDWSGQNGNITEYDGENWIFITKREGMIIYVKDEKAWFWYNNKFWKKFIYSKGPPDNLLIYYGWLNSFNFSENSWNNEKVSQDLAKYNMLVFGDGLQDPSHGDYANTQIILARIKALNPFSKIFGYVGCDQIYSNFATKVDQWNNLQIDGIFLDTAGYDYGTPVTNGREAYNQKVDYIHGKVYSNICFTNSWNIDNVIGTAEDPDYPNSIWNPSLLPSNLSSNDWYLLESFPINTLEFTEGIENKDEWFGRGNKAINHRYNYGINLAGVATISNSNVIAIPLFNFGYVSSLMWGLNAFGSSDSNYGGGSSEVRFWERTGITECGEIFRNLPLVKNGVNDADVYLAYSEFSKFFVDFSSGAQFGKIIFSTYTKPFIVKFMDTITLTNMPAAAREIQNVTSWRLKVDLAEVTRYRVTLNVQTLGTAGADVHFQGSQDGTVWGNLDGNLGPEIPINTTGSKDTGWVDLSPKYRLNNILIRMIEKDGNGTLDPIIRQVLLYFN